MTERLMTAREVATEMKVTAVAVRAAIRAGRIEAVRINGVYHVRRDDALWHWGNPEAKRRKARRYPVPKPTIPASR